MNKKILYILLAVALIAVFLASGYRIPRSVIENAQSVLPGQGASASPRQQSGCMPTRESRGFRCIPVGPSGNIGQLGDGGIPAENQGLIPMGGRANER